MRIRISHRTTYRYTPPASSVIQILRLTPRNHDAQYVARWRVDVSADSRLDQHEDAFGNVTHAFTAEGPLEQIAVVVEGEVETRDAQGIVRGAVERFPAGLFLRETSLTTCDSAIADFTAEVGREAGEDTLKRLHLLLDRLSTEMQFDSDPTHPSTTAAEAFALKRGVCQDLAHVFIAGARNLAIPARYVGGYFCPPGEATEQNSGHAWAEAFVGGLGWVAFDVAHGLCPTDAHVRVAVGLDHLGAAPIRGMRYGGGSESLAVHILVDQAASQTQS